MKNTVVMSVIAAIAAGGLGFFAGVQYQRSQTPQFAFGARGEGMGMQRGMVGMRGGAAGATIFRPTDGEIISSDAQGITVRLEDGSSKIVLVPELASIVQSTEASRSALTVGTKVAVFGTTNSDGSVTAQNIQLNPANRQARPTQAPLNQE